MSTPYIYSNRSPVHVMTTLAAQRDGAMLERVFKEGTEKTWNKKQKAIYIIINN